MNLDVADAGGRAVTLRRVVEMSMTEQCYRAVLDVEAGLAPTEVDERSLGAERHRVTGTGEFEGYRWRRLLSRG